MVVVEEARQDLEEEEGELLEEEEARSRLEEAEEGNLGLGLVLASAPLGLPCLPFLPPPLGP